MILNLFYFLILSLVNIMNKEKDNSKEWQIPKANIIIDEDRNASFFPSRSSEVTYQVHLQRVGTYLMERAGPCESSGMRWSLLGYLREYTDLYMSSGRYYFKPVSMP